MIKHIVLLNFKPTTTPQQIADFSQTAYNTLKALPGVNNLFVGKTMPVRGTPKYQFTLVMDFSDEATLDIYRKHPDHIKFATEVLRPLVDETVVLDFA